MPKGIFTGSLVVLFERAPTPEALWEALSDFQRMHPIETESGPENEWMFGRPGAFVAMRPEVNGVVALNIFSEPWPDSMGDSKTSPKLFAAWSMGWMGPFTYPGALERAIHWATMLKQIDAPEVKGHGAFIRINATYALGGEGTHLPADHRPLEELHFLTRVASAVLKLPGSIAFFNPGGETLRRAADLESSVARHRSQNLPPLELWSAVRVLNLDDSDGWLVMDTVGMEQLDVFDQEACVPPQAPFQLGDVEGFLRNMTYHVMEHGPVINKGDTTDGPGPQHWRAYPFEQSLMMPTRKTLRWKPAEGAEPPSSFGFPTAAPGRSKQGWKS
jgi:hypothetical protein